MSSTTKIEPLGAVRERVLVTLRQEIIAGHLRPGDRLVERELAERFESPGCRSARRSGHW